MNAPAEAPAELAVVLRMDDAARTQLRQAEGIVEIAQAYVIETADDAALAADELRNVKARAKKLEELRVGFVAPARQIIENAKALFLPALTCLAQAEGILKARLLEWDRKEQERVDAERRAREEAERKARQEAEAKAAAERARAEAQAAEARRKAQEAEDARRKAEAEGNARAAAAAAAAAAKAEEAARAAIENGEARAAEAEMSAAASIEPPPYEVQRPKGFASRKNWIAELEPGKTEDEAKLFIIEAVAGGRRELLQLLALDLKAANKLAKALEGNFSVPGLRARNVPIASSRIA